ncbi:hypothetical protein [Desulfosporosinus metallidurans]|nr:hypothetical protein [Desulfosporosinus metallidurans]
MKKHIPIHSINKRSNKQRPRTPHYSLLDMICNRRIRAETFDYFDSQYHETEDEAEIFRVMSSRRKRGVTNMNPNPEVNEMEENKILEILVQLLHGLTELMHEFKQDMLELKQDIQEVKDIQLRMETELTEKFDSLCEIMSVQKDFNKDILERLDRIEAKIEVCS